MCLFCGEKSYWLTLMKHVGIYNRYCLATFCCSWSTSTQPRGKIKRRNVAIVWYSRRLVCVETLLAISILDHSIDYKIKYNMKQTTWKQNDMMKWIHLHSDDPFFLSRLRVNKDILDWHVDNIVGCYQAVSTRQIGSLTQTETPVTRNESFDWAMAVVRSWEVDTHAIHTLR